MLRIHWNMEIPSCPMSAASAMSFHGMRNGARNANARSASAIEANIARSRTMLAGEKLSSAARIAGNDVPKKATVMTKMKIVPGDRDVRVTDHRFGA